MALDNKVLGLQKPLKFDSGLTVAVWMVTYNHEKYIAKAIESVINQETKFKYKLFIGEDNSLDSTAEICEFYANEYPDKIELVKNTSNLGPLKNAIQIYQKCIESKAQYIAILEGDDCWTDHLKLQKQVQVMENYPEASMIIHNAIDIRNNKKRSIIEGFQTGFIPSNLIIQKKMKIPTLSHLFRNELFIFNPLFEQVMKSTGHAWAMGGDRYIQLQMAVRGRVYYINEIMGEKNTLNTGSIKQIKAKRLEAFKAKYNANYLMMKGYDIEDNYFMNIYLAKIAFKVFKISNLQSWSFFYKTLKHFTKYVGSSRQTGGYK